MWIGASKILIAVFLVSTAVAYFGLLGGAAGKLSTSMAVYMTFGAAIAAALAGIGLVAMSPSLMQARR